MKGRMWLKSSSSSIRALPAFFRHAVEIGIEVDIFPHGEILIEAEFLAHIGEMLLDRGRLAADVESGDPWPSRSSGP